MKRGIFLFLVAVPMALALVACEDDAAKPGAATPVAEADLAVPADFAAEAETSITSANYKAELDALDKEIASE